MLHFSIPETVELHDAKGAKYTAYVIHVNGLRHCVVRYRQLFSLHDQLRREVGGALGGGAVAAFPPKRLLPLTLPQQIDERRAGLERFLQSAAKDPAVAHSVAFNGFLLAAQQETRQDAALSPVGGEGEVVVDVFLMNEQRSTVVGAATMQTDDVLERVCKQLGVPDESVYHFALFLLQRKESGDFCVARKLQAYESPYLAQKASSALKLYLRKASWDAAVDAQLMAHPATLNLLYIQTLAEVERGWITATADTRRQLAGMQARGAKKEYMDFASTLPMYGFVHFLPCICDYPMSNTPAQIMIGRRELVMKIRTTRGEQKEGSFKVTKIRCWRIVSLASSTSSEFGSSSSSSGVDTDSKLELSFEYLLSSQQLQWITIVSSQAILMSLCLQSIVEELLRIRNGVPIKKAGEKSCSMEYAFPRRDGTTLKVPIRSGLHQRSDCVSDSMKIDSSTLHSLTGKLYSAKKLSELFSAIKLSEAERAAEDVLFENEAFNDLKDDEL